MSTEQHTPNTQPQKNTARALTGCLIGALIGLGPSIAIAPAWWILILVALLLLRAPLLVTMATALLAKLVALLATPLSYALGSALLDGPTGELFRVAINAPFLALLGLEHYHVTGGLCLAIICALAALPFARRLLNKKTGQRLLRPSGLAAIALGASALWLLQSSAAQGLMASHTAQALGQLNGATVDVSGVDLDLAGSSLTVSDLSLANPHALDQNLFHGLELTANLSTSDLLRKRVHIEQLIIRRADSGTERTVPGVLIGSPPPAEVTEPGAGEKNIEDYLQDWKVWEARLAQAREWIEKTAAQESEPTTEAANSLPAIATHLIDGAPSLLISEINVEGLGLDWLPGENFSVKCSNLSTNPSMVKQPMSFSMGTSSELFQLEFKLPSATDSGRLKFGLRGLQVDTVAKMLRLETGTTLAGGTLDLMIDGPWSAGRAGYIDLPMSVKLHGINLAIGGSKGIAISELTLPIHLNGPIDRPHVRIDSGELQRALRDAGAKQLAGLIDEKKAELIDKGREQLEEALGEKLPGGTLDGALETLKGKGLGGLFERD